jgi:hypothetical protein
MAKYLTPLVIEELATARNIIYAERTKIWSKYGVDLLDTDSLSSIQIYEVVTKYDPDFNINFARNGEDGISKGVLIEQKTSKIEKGSRKANFMFHALGNIFHDRYVFCIRMKKNLELIRLYDISDVENVEKVKNEMIRLKEEYLAKGFRKYDGIFISEDFFLANIKFHSGATVINGCVVYKDML